MELKTKDIAKLKFNNQRFSLTNGKVFLLGILEENAVKDTPVFTVYDECSKKVLFNPLFTILKANNQLLSPKFQKPISHLQTYKLEEDILTRSTTYLIDGVKVTIDSERFIDEHEMVIYMQYKFKTSENFTIDLYHGIDDTCIMPGQDVMLLKSKLHEMTLKTSNSGYMVLMYHKDFRHKNRNKSNEPTEHYIIDAEANRTYTITKVIGYDPRVRRLKKLLKYKLNQTYEKIKKDHIKYKKAEFQQHKMDIISNKKMDLLLAYVYRQHLNNFPSLHSLNQTGFEEYMQILFYIYNDPNIAKRKLLKRIQNIKQYKSDAVSLGFQGAIIIDSVKDFNSGNRTIYKGALLIYLIELYQEITNDLSLIDESVLELSIEICRFYIDYCEMNLIETHFDFNNVSNLNHSLKHINNHTFTNYLIRYAVRTVKLWINPNKKSSVVNRFSKSDLKEFIKNINELNRKIYILKPNNNHLIYPYQNYLVDKERESLDIKEGSMNILIDQFFLFIMFNDEFKSNEINANIKYFSEQSKNFNLNQLLLNLVSSDIMKNKDFTKFFDSVSVFEESLLINSQGIDFGLMGLVYMFVIFRLSGLRYKGQRFIVDSLIPKNIRRLEYDIKYQHYLGTIKIKRNSAQLVWKY
ncbi:MAG: hypothetical protein PF513_05185 [Tenericutes bacterium]|jgi:trehalose/maltose hydrolase-like predicted phosphorylase|nr:hypothetical protein [Mycoplasmatota bacterium]